MIARIGMAALALLSACTQRAQQNVSEDHLTQPPTAPVANGATPAIPPPETGPDARTPLAEPKGPLDPKSAEAAGQVVQHYGALIEQDRWAEAADYWGDKDAAAAFAKDLQSRGLKHLEIGKPSDVEGAAGSSYVTMPVSLYGGSNRSAANVILRRVNDVPGSTEAQRRWHIERIEWRT